MNLTTTRRWADNDSHFGPFTWSKDNYKKYAIALRSGSSEYPGCCLRVSFRTKTLITELPSIIRPHKEWVDTSKYAWAGGCKGYWSESENEYSISASEGSVHLRYGPQTGDSTTEKSKCYFIPWKQLTFHRISLYDLEGKQFWTQLNASREPGLSRYDEQRKAEAACPSATFNFADFDGELISVKTHIEEREWHRGAGWFSWLRFFYSVKVLRFLELKFSKEVGPEKGSWKGGTTGHSIEMRPGELHRAAFLRYCAQHKLTLIREPAE